MRCGNHAPYNFPAVVITGNNIFRGPECCAWICAVNGAKWPSSSDFCQHGASSSMPNAEPGRRVAWPACGQAVLAPVARCTDLRRIDWRSRHQIFTRTDLPLYARMHRRCTASTDILFSSTNAGTPLWRPAASSTIDAFYQHCFCTRRFRSRQ